MKRLSREHILFKKVGMYLIVTSFYLATIAFAKGSFGTTLFLGGVIGAVLLEIENPLSRIVEQPKDRPLFHNVFFQLVVLTMAFYTLLLSESDFSFGLIMGLLLHLLLDNINDYFDEERFLRWFWITRDGTSRFTQRIYFTVMLFLFLYFSVMFVTR